MSESGKKALIGGATTVGLIAGSEGLKIAGAEGILNAETAAFGNNPPPAPLDHTQTANLLNHISGGTWAELIGAGALGLAAFGGFFYTGYQTLKAVFGGDSSISAGGSAHSVSSHRKDTAERTPDSSVKNEAAGLITERSNSMSAANITGAPSDIAGDIAAKQMEKHEPAAAVAAGKSSQLGM